MSTLKFPPDLSTRVLIRSIGALDVHNEVFGLGVDMEEPKHFVDATHRDYRIVTDARTRGGFPMPGPDEEREIRRVIAHFTRAARRSTSLDLIRNLTEVVRRSAWKCASKIVGLDPEDKP